jgi:hypothetical protein
MVIHTYIHTYIHIYIYNGRGRDLVQLHPCIPAAPTTTSRDPGAQVSHAVHLEQGASPENHHDSILLGEWCSVTPLRSFIGLSALGKGS